MNYGAATAMAKEKPEPEQSPSNNDNSWERCPTHRRYEGNVEPLSGCRYCAIIWNKKNYGKGAK